MSRRIETLSDDELLEQLRRASLGVQAATAELKRRQEQRASQSSRMDREPAIPAKAGAADS